MTTETIEEEIQINGSRKIVLGVRCFPELKNKLSQEATDLGITLSEHTENILLNKDNSLDEKEILENNIFLLEDKFSKLNNLRASENSKFRAEITQLKIEVESKRREIANMGAQMQLFNNEYLLKLYTKLRGQTDTVIGNDGQSYRITFDSPHDLLFYMILSFKIKKT